MDTTMSGKVCLITGANSGIGPYSLSPPRGFSPAWPPPCPVSGYLAHPSSDG